MLTSINVSSTPLFSALQHLYYTYWWHYWRCFRSISNRYRDWVKRMDTGRVEMFNSIDTDCSIVKYIHERMNIQGVPNSLTIQRRKRFHKKDKTWNVINKVFSVMLKIVDQYLTISYIKQPGFLGYVKMFVYTISIGWNRNQKLH